MIKGLILTGGKSKRLGTDKYRLEIRKKQQFIYLHDLLTSLEVPTYLSCSEDQAGGLPAEYPRIVDKHLEIGPIGGIATAMAADPLSAWLVIACDLPFVDDLVIRQLMENRSEKAEVVTFRKPGNEFLETTLTIYEPSCLPHLLKAIAQKNYKMQEVLKTLRIKELTPEHEQVLFNVNTRDELEAARRMVAQN